MLPMEKKKITLSKCMPCIQLSDSANLRTTLPEEGEHVLASTEIQEHDKESGTVLIVAPIISRRRAILYFPMEMLYSHHHCNGYKCQFERIHISVALHVTESSG